MSYHYIFKYVIIGDMGVGKSSLMNQFTLGNFEDNRAHTIGVEFQTRLVEIGKKQIKLQIWDTAGQERFRAITRSYYRGSCCVLLVFDILRRTTFTHLTTWLSDAKNLTHPETEIILVGNKCDEAEKREVLYEDAVRFAKENDLTYIETSAKSGTNVQEVFMTTAAKINEKVENGSINPNDLDSGITYANNLFDTNPTNEENSNNCSC